MPLERNEISMNEQIEKLLKEVEELKDNQKKMSEKMEKMQQIIDQIQADIYEFGDPFEDEEGCSGSCCGCSGCGDSDEEK